MYLTGREQTIVAEIFRLLADALPELELRREVGRRLLELIQADELGRNPFGWSDGADLDDLRISRAQHHAGFSDRELALLDLVRPAFAVALARVRSADGFRKPATQAGRPGSDDAFACLTRREREVVELVVEGLLDKEIAQRLGISYTTVRTHVDRSFQKLGVSNRSRLARIARPGAW
ncbi:MAG TPA: helix-turn-helix transcriptional regulator [Paraburkholderia sp.]